MSEWTPTQEWLDEVFDREVRPDVFAHAESVGTPTLVMVGGQPAAGKTRACDWAAAQHDQTFSTVTGDDLRYLHPDYRHLQAHAPLDMPNITQRVSGPLVGRCINEALINRYPLILEGVFRDADLTESTAERFHRAGFTVHAVAVATPPAVSRVSAVHRFLQQARWTPPSAHDSAVEAIPDTVHVLAASPHVARVTVVDRSGRILADSGQVDRQRVLQSRNAIEHAHTRPLTEQEHATTTALQQAISRSAATPGNRLFDLGPVTAARTLLWAGLAAAAAPPTVASAAQDLDVAHEPITRDDPERDLDLDGPSL